MPKFNHLKREVSLRIVFDGPGASGKSSNLSYLHERYAEWQRGRLVTLDGELGRTLSFDCLPTSLGTLRGFAIRVEYLTLPGHSSYGVTRRTLLSGADGVVFVADSDPGREQANLIAHESFVRNLRRIGASLASMPLVYQWNKRDCAGALSVKLLEAQLNSRRSPSVEAVATRGDGVAETERQILALATRALRSNAGEPEAADGRPDMGVGAASTTRA